MMRRAFDELGYRRYEWKCDALNAPSRAAAERLGFRFEGVFRQATIYKGRNRDTAWYSIIDTRVAGAEGGVRGLARPGQLHRRRRSDQPAGAGAARASMKQVMFIELGMGVDLQGQDATKAATRAVRDAIQRNYLPGIRRMLEESRGRMLVHVRLGSPADAPPPDLEVVRASLPYGEVTVELVPGGMLVPNGLDDGGTICVVNAAVEVAVET